MAEAELIPGDGKEGGTLLVLGDLQDALGEAQSLRQVAEADMVSK
jgi:hypothetical protein